VNFQDATLYGADFQGLDLSNTAFDGSRMADWEAFGGSRTDDLPADNSYLAAKSLFTVNFEGAKLRCAGFDNVGMGGVVLKNTDLEHVSFWRSDLSRADLSGANLSEANFQEARLTGADFRGAKNVEKANFTDACSDRPPQFDQSVGAQFKFKPCTVSAAK
jgi:uncharacterized protein YjbI with pentapeptide repeats